MRARVRALLDVGALRENVRLLSEHAGARVLLPVKANGYGHGLREVVTAVRDLPQVWGFAVAVPDEAAQALEVAGGRPVLLLTPAEPDEARELARLGVRLSVNSDAEVRELPPGARAHLKVNTGMNRLGVRPVRALELAAALRERGALEGVFTHFAAADEEDTAHAREQLRVFTGLAQELTQRLPGVLAHASNSGGVLAFGHEAGFDLVRPGVASYGFAPPHLAGVVNLRPVLSVRARVTFVHDVPAGESVGYACLWTAERDTRVAVVAMGYADGFPRRATGSAWVRVRGERREVLGRICMDQFMLDVTGLDVRPGEWLEVFGPDGVTARDVADWAGTNEYEVLTGLGARVERQVLHGGAPSPVK